MLLDISLFLGRFHPVVLHIPIGILFVLCLYEFLFKAKDEQQKAIWVKWGLTVSLVFTAITIVFGLLLETEGGYDKEGLELHETLGYITGVVHVLLLFLYIKQFSPQIRKSVFAIILALVTITGHYGGNLTHGETFLTEHIPGGGAAGSEEGLKNQPEIQSVDSAYVFANVIYPILEKKCVSCHNPGKKKGELIMTSFEAVMLGGKHGASVLEGKPELSDLLRRTILPKDHIAYMPPKGKTPLTEDEIKVIEWWIENGAQDSVLIGSLELEDQVKDMMAKVIGGENDKTFKIEAGDYDSLLVSNAASKGWVVKQISQGSNALRAKAKKDIKLDELKGLEENIYELNIMGRELSISEIDFIKRCKNLAVLNISKCSNVDAVIGALNADKVEVLNLNSSDLTSVDALREFKHLKTLYLMGLSLSNEEVNELKANNDKVDIIYQAFKFST